MLTRDIGYGPYRAGCAGAPPPLHIVPDTAASSWFPVERTSYQNQPPGPQFILAPVVSPYGDDPTDPASQERPHRPMGGMMPRFNIRPQLQRGTVRP